MKKQAADTTTGIFIIINVFNFVSKFIGFAVTKPNDTIFSKIFREVSFFFLLLFALCCTIRAEFWCVQVLNMRLDVRKLIMFVVSQMVNLSPIGSLIFFRLRDLAVWNIVLKVKHLEENLLLCDMYLKITRIIFIGLLFWFFEFFIIVATMYYILWPNMIYFLVDAISIFYFEAWVTIPYLQFIGWICFLCHVSYCVRGKIIEINDLEYLTKYDDFSRIESRLERATNKGYNGIAKVNQIKRIIGILKQVLIVTKELSAAYGLAVLFYMSNYLSRLIIQFYDLIDKDYHRFPFWTIAWNIFVRISFLLPVFICCEQLSYNVNKTIELIQEIVTLHQPSCLDCSFQSLTLRMQHQSITIQICGFLNITYSSFLTIMTTALAFLLLQLQF